jgi:hypothetical protein
MISCTQSETPGDGESSWQRVSQSELSADEHKLFRRAEKARGDLAGTLMSRVTEAISNKGPAGAIEVCNLEAQGLTQQVAEKHDVDIGRTSFRLRNPENKPPGWAREFNLIEKRVDEQVILKKDSEQLAVLSPIRLGKKCATCHGPEERIPEAVKDQLAERYPRDEATGFEPGDLRGWFWVEVPNT